MISLIEVEAIQEGTSKGIEIENNYLFAVKKDAQIFLYKNSCPHLGTPLEWEEDRFLDNDGALIQCANHGALFQIEDGLCLAGPCTGSSLEAIPFSIDGGEIMVEAKYLKLADS